MIIIDIMSTAAATPPPAALATREARAPVPAPMLDAAALLGSAREVLIALGEERYRLRLTRAGKLILTK